MLIRITNHCTMGCSHCMIDASGPDGEHMTLDVFKKALRIARLIGKNAVLISGGEPFDHPDVFEFIQMAQAQFPFVLVASNGLFALDTEMRERVVATGVPVQVINDPRYYPRNLSLIRHHFEHPGWVFDDHLIANLFPCRRTRENGISTPPKAPNCFNLRSITLQYDLISAVTLLQLKGKLCTPSVNADGTIVAGEADTCFRIGTIDSTEGELDEAIRTMQCNRCDGLKTLSPQHLTAIGETR